MWGERSRRCCRSELARWAIRWICTNNPFYAISAGLFLVGLWISFPDPNQAEDTWALMSGLVGYTLLLAGTAFLLVRFAKVWDDARTVLLLVVLMFLATSVTFDQVLVLDVLRATPARGIACFCIGLVFAVVVSEALLRGIGHAAVSSFFACLIIRSCPCSFFIPWAWRYWWTCAEAHSEEAMWGNLRIRLGGGTGFPDAAAGHPLRGRLCP